MSGCKKWYFFDGLFIVSICRFDSWVNQLVHLFIHLGIALLVDFIAGGGGMIASLIVAVLTETWDGFTSDEGFNIYPDLVFRFVGAFVGGMIL